MTRSQRQNSVRRFCAFFSAIPHCFCKRKKRNKHFHTIVHTILRLLKKLTNSLLHLNKILSNFKYYIRKFPLFKFISPLSLSLTRFRPIEKIKKDARSRNIIIPREYEIKLEDLERTWIGSRKTLRDTQVYTEGMISGKGGATKFLLLGAEGRLLGEEKKKEEETKRGDGKRRRTEEQRTGSKTHKRGGEGGGILEYPERCIQVKRGRRNRLFCQGRKKERREEREKDEQNGMQEKWKMKFDSINQREKSYTFNKQTRKI